LWHERAPNPITYKAGNMASSKRIKPRSRFGNFSQVKGKTISLVEIDEDASAILILFEDDTALSFNIDSSHTVFPELSSRKRGNWKPIKRWPPIYSPLTMVKWP
jgi:hypothetical protein